MEESESEDETAEEEMKKEKVSRTKKEKTVKKEMMEAAKKEIPYTFEGMAQLCYFLVYYCFLLLSLIFVNKHLFILLHCKSGNQ